MRDKVEIEPKQGGKNTMPMMMIRPVAKALEEVDHGDLEQRCKKMPRDCSLATAPLPELSYNSVGFF